MGGDRCRYSRYHTSLATVAGTAGTITVWRPLPVQPVQGGAHANAALGELGIVHVYWPQCKAPMQCMSGS